MKYPTITLHQPWASWICWGLKTIETRRHGRFRSLLGKRIAIHAGLAFDDWAIEEATGILSAELSGPEVADKLTNDAEPTDSWREIWVPGGVVCLATVTEFRRLTQEDELAALCHCEGSHGLALEDIECLKRPFRIAGNQGIWTADLP